MTKTLLVALCIRLAMCDALSHFTHELRVTTASIAQLYLVVNLWRVSDITRSLLHA